MDAKKLELIYEFDVEAGWTVYSGKRMDPFDIVDALHGTDSKVYLHDLDSRAKGRPQLDLVQDLSLEIGVWYDGGARVADNVIDPLVAGAEMVALDPAYMKNETEFDHIMKLTNNVCLDLLSEHEDRIPDYNGSVVAGRGLSTLLGMGYRNFVIRKDELGAFDSIQFDGVASVWIRDGEMPSNGAEWHRRTNVAGTVKGIGELVIEDEG